MQAGRLLFGLCHAERPEPNGRRTWGRRRPRQPAVGRRPNGGAFVEGWDLITRCRRSVEILVTTSKALVTTSVAPVTTRFLLLLAWHLLLLASCYY